MRKTFTWNSIDDCRAYHRSQGHATKEIEDHFIMLGLKFGQRLKRKEVEEIDSKYDINVMGGLSNC